MSQFAPHDVERNEISGPGACRDIGAKTSKRRPKVARRALALQAGGERGGALHEIVQLRVLGQGRPPLGSQPTPHFVMSASQAETPHVHTSMLPSSQVKIPAADGQPARASVGREEASCYHLVEANATCATNAKML